MTEKKLTLYHVLYMPNDVVEAVREVRMSGAPEAGPRCRSRLQQPAGSNCAITIPSRMICALRTLII